MALNPQRLNTELETLAGLGRGKKDDQAVRFRDLKNLQMGLNEAAVRDIAEDVVGDATGEGSEISDLIKDAQDAADQAAQDAQDANDNATAAHLFADQLVQSVTGQFYEIMESGFALSSESEGRNRAAINDTFLISSDWSRYGGAGTLVQGANTIYPIGRDWDFTVNAAQLDGIQILDSPDTIWTGQKNAAGYVVEVVWTLEGGTWAGAGVRLTWRNSANADFAVNMQLSAMEQGANTPGRARVSRAVFVKPGSFTGTFTGHRLFVFANWNGTGFTPSIKRIKFHRVSVRPASPSEIASGSVAMGSQAWLDQRFMTATSVDAAIANFDMDLYAELGTGWARVKQTSTAIASINGSVARTRNMVTVDGINYAGIEAVAFDGTGMGTGTVLKLWGDQVIVPGSLSAREVVIHDGSGNMFPDPAFTNQSLRSWTAQGTGPASAFVPRKTSDISSAYTTIASNAPSDTLLMVRNHSGQGNVWLQSAKFPAGANEIFTLQFDMACAAGGAHTITLRMRLFDNAGASLGFRNLTQSVAPATWQRYSGTVTLPAGTASAAIEIVSLDDGTMAQPAFLTNFTVIRKRTGSTLITPNSLTTDLVNTVDFNAAGLAVFGGTLRSDNFNAGAGTGWQLTQAGALTVPNASITGAKIGTLQVDTLHIKDRAITDHITDELATKTLDSNAPPQSVAHTMTFVLAQPAAIIYGWYFDKVRTGGSGQFITWLHLDGVEIPSTEENMSASASRGLTGIRTANLSAGSHTLRIIFTLSSATPTYRLENINLFVFRSYK